MIQLGLFAIAATLLYMAHPLPSPVTELVGAIFFITCAGLWAGYASRRNA